jgi:uncharacterized protein (DUF58 family)
MRQSCSKRLPLRSRLASRFRALATYDVFPDFSARVRRLFYNPFGVLILAALAALVCGLFLHPQGFVLCGGVLAVIGLGIAWPVVSLRGMHGTIAFANTRVYEGEPVQVGLTLGNRLPWSAWGLAVRGGFTRAAAANDLLPAATIASVPRRRTVRCAWSFVPTCRGVYPLAAPELTTGFPFGLWENRRLLNVETPLLVWPRTFPVGPVPLVSGYQQVEGNVSRNQVGSHGDVLGVRPYRRGDSPRRIHWGQSARQDRLIVCELQSNARPSIQLILDADPRVHSGDGSEGSREWAIRIVASLARGWLAAGAQVGAVWNGQAIPAASGPAQLQRLLDSLAQLPGFSCGEASGNVPVRPSAPDQRGPALAETLASPACRGFQDGWQVVVTTDTALVKVRSFPTDESQRWVILRAAGFGECATSAPPAPPMLPVRPWLWIESAERIPDLLRGGWKEAQHGS